jgi:hypothetical protein
VDSPETDAAVLASLAKERDEFIAENRPRDKA